MNNRGKGAISIADKVMSEKYDIFISYRRDGGEYTAKILRDRLEELGYNVFFDVESLRSGDFNTKLYSVIDQCKDFLLILSPNALDRCVNQDDWVRREIEYALQQEKNIIPVMLRGFSFPDVLPEPLALIRYKNGLEANTQFFDAFVKKLDKFLISKPPLWSRIIKNPLFKKTLPALLALIIFAAALFCGYQFLRFRDQSFPRTATEKSVTFEVIYYVESNLTYLDMMADAAGQVIEDTQRYLNSGSSEYTALQNSFEVAYQTFEKCDLDSAAPSDGFLERVGNLEKTPYSVADIIGMHSAVYEFRNSWIGYLAWIQWVAGPDSFLSTSAKLAIVDNYQKILNEELNGHAYNTNELLVQITSKSILDEFFGDYLPLLKRVPLSAGIWNTDVDVLEASITACDNREAAAINNLTALLGNTTMENAALRENLILAYESLGMSRERAEEYIELQLQLQEVFQELRPSENDSEEVLWVKLAGFVNMGYYDSAMDCVDMIEGMTAESDPYAAAYIPALRLFLNSIYKTEVNYGVMVVGWFDPDLPSERFCVGDIIVELNGETCYTYQQYADIRAAMTESEYTVTVLRTNSKGVLERIDLELADGMPLVYMRTLTSYGYDTYGTENE